MKTFLSKSTGIYELYIAGIKFEIRSNNDNTNDGFNKYQCKSVHLPLIDDPIYLFDGYGYIDCIESWKRFKMIDYIILNN